MLRKLYEWLTGPSVTYTAHLRTSEFLTAARVEPDPDGELSHALFLEFSEPVRDGNDLSHINFRGEDGLAISQKELITGDTAEALGFDPEPFEIDVVFVTRDDEVYATDTVEVRAEQPSVEA